jgi:hypothetical protein
MQHTTRVDIDAQHHVTVDWAVSYFSVARNHWHVHARCVMWRSVVLQSGVNVAVKRLTPEVDIDVEGPSLEQTLAHLMHEAHARCLAALERAIPRL